MKVAASLVFCLFIIPVNSGFAINEYAVRENLLPTRIEDRARNSTHDLRWPITRLIGQGKNLEEIHCTGRYSYIKMLL